ncbi:FAD-dependent oxidoreductase [Sulfolobus acidocaldarius SUSAZ]|nr:FAD-dependent oxidoreductase [Sulfolobus acidocaldarius SUSAZ]
MKQNRSVIVIGGGATGLFTALDLSLRGINVTLVERGDIASGTSGKFHGLLHSGARYAVNDPESAKECKQENEVLSKIAPEFVRDTGGVFVGVTEDDVNYSQRFLSALNSLGITNKVMDVEELIRREPFINKKAKIAIWVPDKVVYGYDLLATVALTASLNGARILTYNEVRKVLREGNSVRGVEVKDNISGETKILKGDIIVNTAGPWAFRVIEMAGLGEIPLLPTAGIMVVMKEKLNSMVMNRLRPPSDGDIIVPYGDSSIIGTTATIIPDPNDFEISEEDIKMLIEEGAYMIPKLREVKPKRAYASVRPLIKNAEDGRGATRDFMIIDHEKVDGLDGLISVIGGKFTTSRLAGERVSDMVSEKLGIREKSKTATIKLTSELDEELLEKKRIPKVLVKMIRDRKGSLDEDRYSTAMYILLSLLAKGE